MVRFEVHSRSVGLKTENSGHSIWNSWMPNAKVSTQTKKTWQLCGCGKRPAVVHWNFLKVAGVGASSTGETEGRGNPGEAGGCTSGLVETAAGSDGRIGSDGLDETSAGSDGRIGSETLPSGAADESDGGYEVCTEPVEESVGAPEGPFRVLPA